MEFEKRKVLGEGSAMFVMETAESATARGAKILAEFVSYGMSMDAEGFLAANLGTDGLKHAVQLALTRAGIAPEQIGLLVWAPQGNRQDESARKFSADASRNCRWSPQHSTPATSNPPRFS